MKNILSVLDYPKNQQKNEPFIMLFEIKKKTIEIPYDCYISEFLFLDVNQTTHCI